jgi:hypothetical protein
MMSLPGRPLPFNPRSGNGRPLIATIGLASGRTVAIGLAAPGANASTRHHRIRHRSIRYDITALPSQLFAPYFETYNASGGQCARRA